MPIKPGTYIGKFIFLMSVFPLLFAPNAGMSNVQAGLGAPWWSDLSWSPDGNLLAGVGANGDLALFTSDLTPIEPFENVNLYYGEIAWSPDGDYLAVIEQPYGYSVEQNTRYFLSIWSINPLEEIGRIASGNGTDSQPAGLAWQADGSTILTEVAGVLQTVDSLALTYEPLPITLPETSESRYLAFNQDVTQATYLINRPSQDTVRMYNFDLATGEMEWEVNLDLVGTWNSFIVEGTIPVTDFPADNLAWSSDGQIAISGYFLAIYVPDDESLRLLTSESEVLIHHLEWSPDGRYLAVVVGNSVEIWDATIDERIEAIYTNTDNNANRNPYTVAWHPDGNMLAVSLILGPELLSLDVSHLYEDSEME